MVLPLIPLLGVLGPQLLSLVPDLAKWLAGDKAGDVAAQAIQVAQAVTGTTDPVAAAGVIAGMTPEQRMELQVRLAEITQKAEADQRRTELEQVKAELENTADARRTMVELNKTNSNLAWMPAYQTIAVGVAFIGSLMFLFAMQFFGLGDLKSGMREILVMLLGILAGEFRGACQFWIGGSRAGSQAASAAVSQAVSSIPTRPISPPVSPNQPPPNLPQARPSLFSP